MKKLLIYSWLPCLVAMFMCETLTACDDDDDVNYSNAIIGTWQSANEYEDDYSWYNTMEVNEDGTFTEIYYYYYKGNYSYQTISTGTYTLAGDKATLKYDDEGEYTLTIAINGNTMKVSYGYYSEYYTKVK